MAQYRMKRIMENDDKNIRTGSVELLRENLNSEITKNRISPTIRYSIRIIS